MKFDDILGSLGGFGLFQVLVMIIWIIFSSVNGWQFMLTVFIASKMDHWCKIPQLQHLNETMQKWIGIPQTTGPLGDTVYKKCSMFNYSYSDINFTDPNIIDTWVSNWTASEISCNNGWVFDKSVRESSVVSEFKLVCDNDWMYTLPATLQMVGLLFGPVLSGLISDRFGRKRTAIGMQICSMGFILGGAFSKNFILFLAMRFLSLLTSIGTYTCVVVLTVEMMPPVYRTHATICLCLSKIFGMFLALTAFFVRGHEWLQIISVFVLVPGFIAVLFLPESPRWLISKGRHKEAEDICKRIAKVNKVTLPEDFSLGESVRQGDEINAGQSKVSAIALFCTPNMRKRTLIVWVLWFAVVFGSYAMRLNIGTLIPGNIYLNSGLINGLADVIVPFILLIALFKTGRRPIVISFFILNGILILVMIGLLPTKIVPLTTSVSFIGMVVISALFTTIYLYSNEIFPTPARVSGLGSSSSFGRIGGLISPNIPLLGNIWYGLPYVILGVIPLIAGVLAFLLPETKDRKLPETFTEAEQFSTKDIADRKDTERDSARAVTNDCSVGKMQPSDDQEDTKNGETKSNKLVDRSYDGIQNMGFDNPIDLTML